MSYWTFLPNSSNVLIGKTITPSSADSNYPVLNLTTLPISKPWRSTSTTADLQIDLGSALPISLAALINHNLSSGATITLNGGSSANPNGSQFTTTITWRNRDCFKLLSSAQTWRYWKILVTDAGNPSAYIKIGYAMFGNAAAEQSFNFRYGWEFEIEQHNNEVESEYGSPHVLEMFDRVRLSLPFENITVSEAITLQNLYKTLKRNLIPFFLIPDVAVNDGYFGRWVSSFVKTEDFYKSVEVVFLEDGPGNEIAA